MNGQDCGCSETTGSSINNNGCIEGCLEMIPSTCVKYTGDEVIFGDIVNKTLNEILPQLDTYIQENVVTFNCGQLSTCSITNLGDVNSTATPNNSEVLAWDGNKYSPYSLNALGGFTSFSLAGSSGTLSTVNSGSAVNIVQGTGISTNGNGAGSITVSLNANIDDLLNTNIYNPQSSEVLTFNGTNWINTNITTLLPSINLAINDLTDVNTSLYTPSNNDVLTWDSGLNLWKPLAVSTVATTNSLTSATNTLTSDVNGVVDTANIVNSLSVTTVGNNISVEVNGQVSATDTIIDSNTIALDKATGITSTINGVSNTQTIPSGTLVEVLGFDLTGNLVYQLASALSGGSGWGLNGNTGTNPTTDFIGNIDNQPINFRINDTIIGNFGIDGSVTFGFSNINTSTAGTISGGDSNSATMGTYITIGGGQYNVGNTDYATVGGGHGNTSSNVHATIGGGDGNTAIGFAATIAGGQSNQSSGNYSAITGGQGNIASGLYSNVSAGQGNTAGGLFSTVGGGYLHQASGIASTVSGGYNNIAAGNGASISGGYNNTAPSYGEWVGGLYGTTYTPISSNSYSIIDRIFNIGNGTTPSTRSDVFTILKGGKVGIDIDNFETTTSSAKLQVSGNLRIQDGTQGSTKVLVSNNNGETSWKFIYDAMEGFPPPAYADDTAAGLAGLLTGHLYQTDGTGINPFNHPGILMVKQ